jgi:hypothetical protein
MRLGDETVQLLPFKNWGQLDLHKWTARGKLPATPAGLEVTPDHVKIAGETVATNDPDGCGKLEKAFNDWLSIETKNLQLARAAAVRRPVPTTELAARKTQPQPAHFRVGVDKRGQIHVDCLQGAEMVASIGLNVAGFNALFSQGIMRKPRDLDVGALHDWVEIDGELFSFEHGNNDSQRLEAWLNAKYLPSATAGSGKDVVVFANAASPTGFDVQFPVTVGGVSENRRRTLNDTTLDLLQDPTRCGLLQPGLIIKLSPPTFIFKKKTPDGGEAYLARSPENTVRIVNDDSFERLIDLSHPVNYTKLTVMEMAAVLNHPAIHRHSQSQTQPLPSRNSPDALPAEPTLTHAEAPPVAPAPPVTSVLAPPVQTLPLPTPVAASPPAINPVEAPLHCEPEKAPPNKWLQPLLAQNPIRYDWFACLVYGKIAQRFGNSRESTFGPSLCWCVALDEAANPEDAAFKGVFLTQKHGFGFLGHARMVRFHQGVAFLGTRQSVTEGIDIYLRAVALDDRDHFIFIVSDGYRSKFDGAAPRISQDLAGLTEAGASLFSVSEILTTTSPVTVVWTVPADQSNPVDPQAVETLRP